MPHWNIGIVVLVPDEPVKMTVVGVPTTNPAPVPTLSLPPVSVSLAVTSAWDAPLTYPAPTMPIDNIATNTGVKHILAENLEMSAPFYHYLPFASPL